MPIKPRSSPRHESPLSTRREREAAAARVQTLRTQLALFDAATTDGVFGAMSTRDFLVESLARAEQELLEYTLDVVAQETRHQRRHADRARDLDDLLQEVMSSVCAESLNLSEADDLHGHLAWRVRWSLKRSIAVRLGMSLGDLDTYQIMRRNTRHLAERYRREPTATEIAADLDLPFAKVHRLVWSVATALLIEASTTAVTPETSETLPDPGALDPLDALLLREQEASKAHEVSSLLKSLTPVEEKVLRMRFEIEDSPQVTPEQVDEDFEVTRERIRQIAAKFRPKLHRPSRKQQRPTSLDTTSVQTVSPSGQGAVPIESRLPLGPPDDTGSQR